MQQNELIPHLFRTEYRKIVAVLGHSFGLDNLGAAEDIASDTFLLAAETWGIKGLPENPTAWLYTVSKNRAIDFLRRNNLFKQKISREIKVAAETAEPEIDLSETNILDSQLRMMFAVCHPAISAEAQIGLSLRVLCGFGIEEIADAFLSNKETINKRLSRAKEKLRTAQIKLEVPGREELNHRLDSILRALYLLFNEGYCSQSQNIQLRKDFCLEAMRLVLFLTENETTDQPKVHALLALMCFHASRFEARSNQQGEVILYEDQDESLWNSELIKRGEQYLNQSAKGAQVSRYHLEAAIAYWHTLKGDSPEKWENILQLYNQLLQLEYSPIAALNRTFALSKANGKPGAILEAEQLNLEGNHLYHTLLGELYSDIDREKALMNFEKALLLAKSAADKTVILNKKRICEQRQQE